MSIIDPGSRPMCRQRRRRPSRSPKRGARRASRSTRRRCWCWAILAALGLAACTGGPEDGGRRANATNLPDSPPTAFDGVRLFDGSHVIENATVLVRDGLIESVGHDLPIPEDFVVVSGEGRTLLPGLIDAHTHVRSPHDLRQALAFGVTTELEMMGDPVLAERIQSRERQGLDPDLASLQSAGHPLTAEGGHGTEYGRPVPTVASPDEVAAWMQDRAAEGSDFIKIMYDDGTPGFFDWPAISRETLFEAVRTAHALEKLAVVHITDEEDALAAVEAGADGLAHIPFNGIQRPHVTALIVEEGVFTISTLAVFFSICDPDHGDQLANDARVARYLSADAGQHLRRGYPMPLRPECRVARETVRKLLAAGAVLLAGTDAGEQGAAHGVSMHDELALLVDAGMSAQGALAAATKLTAERFGLSDRGVVVAGTRADLLLVDGDPTREVTSTRSIVGVWRMGRRFDHHAYTAAIAK
jgi:imidazolonepropionase-like amidohydrolase